MVRPRAYNAADEIVDKVRERILIGDLKPRARLTLREIASEYGSSVMPARDAVQRLLGEGLAIQEGLKTVVVAPLNIGDFLDIMEIRMLLEPRALELSAPRLTAADIGEARRLIQQSLQCQECFAFSDLHRQFHMVLYRRAGRPRLLEVIERQHIHLLRYLCPRWEIEGVQANWRNDEAALLDHVVKGRMAEAVAYLRGDLENAIVRVLRAMET